MGGDADASSKPAGTAPLPDWWWALDLRWRRTTFGVVAIVAVVAVVVIASLLRSDGVVRNEAARFVAELPAERVALWDEIAQCETEGDWSNRNDPFYGGLQFTIDSWRAVGGLGRADQVPREEQIMRAERLLEEQGWDAWPACSTQLGLR